MILTILDGPNSPSGNDRRRYVQIGLLALALLLVAVLGFRQVQRLITPKKDVWVASSSLSPGALVGPGNLKRVKMSESALPSGVVTDARAIAGRQLSHGKKAGEPFVSSDFASGTRAAAAIAEMVPDGRVLTTIRVGRGLIPYRNLRNGDRVDIVDIGSSRGSARVIAHDAYVIGAMYATAPPLRPGPGTPWPTSWRVARPNPRFPRRSACCSEFVPRTRCRSPKRRINRGRSGWSCTARPRWRADRFSSFPSTAPSS